ncbi:MAG: DUF5723 family protein [Bacteroidota bacterium]
MKKHILFILGALGFFASQAQLDLGTHFLSNTLQSNLTNPAAFSDYKINVSLLPSVYAGVYNSAFRPSSVLEKREQDFYLDMDELVSRIGSEGWNVQGDVRVETFSFAFRAKKFQVGISHGFRVHMNQHLPQAMLRFGWGGNAQFVGQTINIAPSLNMLAYQEYGVNVGYQVSKRLTLGTRLKYLLGTATYATANSRASIYTDPVGYELTGETDYRINTSGLPESDINAGDFFDFDEFELDLSGPNQGFAFDLGASLDLTDKVTIQTSILNIGKINWKDNVYNYVSNGITTFEGLDFQPIIDEGTLDTEEILDTIAQTFEFETTSENFSTTLPTSFYLSGTYEVRPKLTVGALFFAQGFHSELTTAVALNVRKDFGKSFSLGAQYANVEGGANNLGLSTTVQLGPVQIYATSDNIVPIFKPLRGQNVNFRFGMNLVFGKIEGEESNK